VQETYEAGKWFSIQIVVGYKYADDEVSDQVVAEEKSYLVFAYSDEALWSKADELLALEATEHEQDDYELGIYDPNKDVVSRAKPVGVHLRRLSIITSSEHLGKPVIEYAESPEAVFQCMVFETYDDFYLYASGHESNQPVRVKMFTNPNHYMFCPVKRKP